MRIQKTDTAETRFKCYCAYDGTDFSGWQSQANAVAIQDIIEARLQTIFKQPVKIHASGRTDAGVHAHQQVFHFDAVWRHDIEKLGRALRGGFPDSIQITQIFKAKPTFHARFSATGKRYCYRLHTERADPMQTRYTWSLQNPVNLERMHSAAKLLIGTHDFVNFSARRNDGSDENLDTIRTLTKLDISQRGSRITITAEADGFLYKMVRTLVGAVVECGLGKIEPHTLSSFLDTPFNPKRPFPVAPAHGLCLEKVFYARREKLEVGS